MQSIIVSFAAILAATTIAVPVAMMKPRQIGDNSSPVDMVLSQVGTHLPGANDKALKTNGTAKPKDPLSSLTGLTKGLGL
ncbi:hypothetical protein F5B22DRAFT_641539 [Xylaria bambusicola]|uniref:uncharacterized protein n=1 Tax=Xylaria bambusicola TaxID=326684 RepID=UPI002008B6D0|nr:uncharacterized protein F5B22DRAFT_641539 [Xylaria bambusicola]KAI0526394.1 hypothetical protein F5B22DRAFT_641539 [Xylaria bambusicola]